MREDIQWITMQTLVHFPSSEMGTFWSTLQPIAAKLSTGTRSHCSSAQLATSARVMLFKRSMTSGSKPSFLCTASDKAAKSALEICVNSAFKLLPANDLSFSNWASCNFSQAGASFTHCACKAQHVLSDDVYHGNAGPRYIISMCHRFVHCYYWRQK